MVEEGCLGVTFLNSCKPQVSKALKHVLMPKMCTAALEPLCRNPTQ